MTSAPVEHPYASIAALARTAQWLAACRNDLGRLEVRDQAKAAAVVLQLPRVRVEASVLEARAERAIHQANPLRRAGRPALGEGHAGPKFSRTTPAPTLNALMWTPIIVLAAESIVFRCVAPGHGKLVRRASNPIISYVFSAAFFRKREGSDE